MKSRLLPLLLALAACNRPGAATPEGDGKEKRETLPLPVRTVAPVLGEVAAVIQTQATLESDRRADLAAEIEGRVEQRLRDLGDRVGGEGADSLLLARLERRELALATKEAAVRLREKQVRIEEQGLARGQAERDVEQARVLLAEATSVLARTTSGTTDGTISREEHERATFAKRLAESRLLSSETALAKAEVALRLAAIAVEEAEVALARAEEGERKALVRSPIAGVVTLCNVREGERVRMGDLLYRVEDPRSLVVYAQVPAREAARVGEKNEVVVGSSAAPTATSGKVVLVAPTIERESGTVRCKIVVEPAQGFRPGLFVNLRIIVERRAGALVVPKRCVLHDGDEGTYLFTIDEGKAVRRLVRTGLESGDGVEIADGLDEGAAVVIEGQDTLTHGAAVEIRAS